MTYRGMEGVAGDLEGPFVGSKSAMIAALKDERIVVATGDFGALTAWRDDAGLYRAEFHRRLMSLAKTWAPSRTGLYGFVALCWPALHDADAKLPESFR